jgi:hypothetical protein
MIKYLSKINRNFVVSINIREYRRAIKIDYPEKLGT